MKNVARYIRIFQMKDGSEWLGCVLWDTPEEALREINFDIKAVRYQKVTICLKQ